MSPVLPRIDPRIAEIAPGFRAISITVAAGPLLHPDVARARLARACESLLASRPEWGETHFTAWAEVFRRFGAKAQRTPNSAQALYQRVQRGGSLPTIDPVVDLYNATSLMYGVPIGGENYGAYVGMPHLTIADGSERFDTVKEGIIIQESPAPGEVIWRDEQGVTCRRWNWRQGVRTRLDATAQQMWFILESLPPMPLEALQAAANDLVEGLLQMMPDARIAQHLIDTRA
ncbi:B3/B4 domain-containing protein [Aeromonas crassostreae]